MRSADLPIAPFFRELRADKERSKETPMKNTSLLLTVSRNDSKVTKRRRGFNTTHFNYQTIRLK